ncbi:iron chaperone [Streptomyces hirsutus]|uniref:iron chaperone n=1 Tax=Streptomyces hirsutus TaxID=35620 RepID=UPI0033212712
MAQSTAADVDSYLSEAPEGRRAALAELRRLCGEELKGFAEVMAYGMPAYERDGTAEIAFASQKQYVSFYLMRSDFYLMRSDVRAAFEDRLAGHDMGKSCLRFRKPEDVEGIDFGLVRDLLRATASGPGTVC